MGLHLSSSWQHPVSWVTSGDRSSPDPARFRRGFALRETHKSPNLGLTYRKQAAAAYALRAARTRGPMPYDLDNVYVADLDSSDYAGSELYHSRTMLCGPQPRDPLFC